MRTVTWVPETLAEPFFGAPHHRGWGAEIGMDPNIVVLYQLPQKSQTLLQNLPKFSYSGEPELV